MEVQNTIVAVISKIEEEHETKLEHSMNGTSYENIPTVDEKVIIEKKHDGHLNHENFLRINERNLEIEAVHDIHMQPCVSNDNAKGNGNGLSPQKNIHL